MKKFILAIFVFSVPVSIFAEEVKVQALPENEKYLNNLTDSSQSFEKKFEVCKNDMVLASSALQWKEAGSGKDELLSRVSQLPAEAARTKRVMSSIVSDVFENKDVEKEGYSQYRMYSCLAEIGGKFVPEKITKKILKNINSCMKKGGKEGNACIGELVKNISA